MIARSQQLRLPRFMTRGGVRGWLQVVAAGALLGGLALVPLDFLSPRAAFGLLVILLGMIAAVYLGFALQDGRLRAFGVEYVGMVGFAAVAAVALVFRSPVLLAAGYFGHGLWDAVHHDRALDTRMPAWYVPLCLGFDAVVGLYVLIRFT